MTLNLSNRPTHGDDDPESQEQIIEQRIEAVIKLIVDQVEKTLNHPILGRLLKDPLKNMIIDFEGTLERLNVSREHVGRILSESYIRVKALLDRKR